MLIVGLRGEEYSWKLGDTSGFLSGGSEVLQDWSTRYGRAVVAGDEGALFSIGREMFSWLDESGAATHWASQGELVLEVHGDPGQADGQMVDALLDTPWEVLAGDQGFLAAEVDRLFSVARRVVPEAKPLEPAFSDLSLMFMAASPEGQQALDYEAEEVATRSQTDGVPLAHVVVEESGSVDFLGDRLALDGPFEVAHLSCHGDIDKDGPYLALETDVGGMDKVTPSRLIEALGNEKPSLVFVSACRTAEAGSGARPVGGGSAHREGLAEERVSWSDKGAPSPPKAAPELAQSYVRCLATQIANVVGWDGSVRDLDATLFAEVFYKELSRWKPVPIAAAQARRALFHGRQQGARLGQHWHLARVYLGPYGGGPLCKNDKPTRKPANLKLERAFLDPKGERVPVAPRSQFVGRRRQIQAVFRVWRDGSSGVLVHGMGNLGKSSLAARIASRLPHHETAVVCGRYDALSIFEQIEKALPPEAKLSMAEKLPTWKAMIEGSTSSISTVLELMLEGVLNTDPVLLIIDDLEQALVDPSEGDGAIAVKAAYREALTSVLQAFAQATTKSRLLLTSRYRFTLPDGSGRDLADILAAVQLHPMAARERTKQWQASVRAQGKAGEEEIAKVDGELLALVVDAAGGNPGLQEILTRPLLAGDIAVSRKAAEAVQHYRKTGEHPSEENVAHEFFQRVSFETYSTALTSGQKEVLTAATLFSDEVPVPLTALVAAAGEITLATPASALERLLVLGLLDSFGEIGGHAHAAINPLARPLADQLGEDQQEAMARVVMPCLIEAWADEEGAFPRSPLSVEAARLALLAKAGSEAINATAEAATAYLYHHAHDARSALDVTWSALANLDAAGGKPAPWLLLRGVDCAERLGETVLLNDLLLVAEDLRDQKTFEAGSLLLRSGPLHAARGSVDLALADNQAAAAIFAALGQDRERAIAQGQIADILAQQGQVEEVLRIRQEEELPVYEKLGAIREKAVTMGKIADILAQQGQVEEVLRIRQEEELPVYEKLGAIREKAVTMGKIADILAQQGQVEEALRIRQEEELPVYEKLGAIREKAVTMGKIADILAQQGQVEEALRIRQEEQLPVYEKLGAIREKAVTMGKIADILAQQDQVEEALRIRQEEQLPVYEKLSAIREKAVIMGKIADILAQQGQVEEALRIRQEEQLPVYEKLGAIREKAVTMGKIADILAQQGQVDPRGRSCASDRRRNSPSMRSSAPSERRRSPWARSPTSWRNRARSRRPCASDRRSNSPSMRSSAPSERRRSPWARSPTS